VSRIIVLAFDIFIQPVTTEDAEDAEVKATGFFLLSSASSVV
jgi:hypothetical protein